MFLILFSSSLIFLSFAFAEDVTSRELHLVGRVLPTVNLKVVSSNELDKKIELELSSNATYSTEKQKIFLTDLNHNKVDMQARFLDAPQNSLKHEIVMNYVKEIDAKNDSLILNIQTN